MVSFLKQIFTWWHKQTVGTFIYTLFTGKFAGSDQFENKYYMVKYLYQAPHSWGFLFIVQNLQYQQSAVEHSAVQ